MLSSTTSANALDVAVRLTAAQQRLETTLSRRRELEAQLAVLSDEVKSLERREADALRELVADEAAAIDRAFRLCDEVQDEDSLSQLLQVVEAFTAKEQTSLASAERELDAYREGVANELREMELSVADVREHIEEHKGSTAARDQESKSQRAEILRLQQERIELEARTDATLLRHARELFC